MVTRDECGGSASLDAALAPRHAADVGAIDAKLAGDAGIEPAKKAVSLQR